MYDSVHMTFWKRQSCTDWWLSGKEQWLTSRIFRVTAPLCTVVGWWTQDCMPSPKSKGESTLMYANLRYQPGAGGIRGNADFDQ